MNTRFVLPAMLLAEASDFFDAPAEKLIFATGLMVGQDVILTHLVPVQFTATRAGAAPIPRSLLKAEQDLAQLGMRLYAMWHSHPTLSPNGIYPSYDDMKAMKVWESDGPFLALIFTEDGRYARHFQHSQNNALEVVGNVHRPERDLFELARPGKAPFNSMPTEEGEQAGPVEPDRPAGEDRVVETGHRVAVQRPRGRSRWNWF